jgi:hypothetical protein
MLKADNKKLKNFRFIYKANYGDKRWKIHAQRYNRSF